MAYKVQTKAVQNSMAAPTNQCALLFSVLKEPKLVEELVSEQARLAETVATSPSPAKRAACRRVIEQIKIAVNVLTNPKQWSIKTPKWIQFNQSDAIGFNNTFLGISTFEIVTLLSACKGEPPRIVPTHMPLHAASWYATQGEDDTITIEPKDPRFSSLQGIEAVLSEKDAPLSIKAQRERNRSETTWMHSLSALPNAYRIWRRQGWTHAKIVKAVEIAPVSDPNFFAWLHNKYGEPTGAVRPSHASILKIDFIDQPDISGFKKRTVLCLASSKGPVIVPNEVTSPLVDVSIEGLADDVGDHDQQDCLPILEASTLTPDQIEIVKEACRQYNTAEHALTLTLNANDGEDGWCQIWQAYHTECMITGCEAVHDTLRQETYVFYDKKIIGPTLQHVSDIMNVEPKLVLFTLVRCLFLRNLDLFIGCYSLKETDVANALAEEYREIVAPLMSDGLESDGKAGTVACFADLTLNM